MSQENADLYRRFVKAFNARDVEALVALFDPEIEFHSIFAAVGGAPYHGHDGIRKWHQDFEEVWGDEIRAEPEAFFDLGEHMLVLQVLRGRGRQSGAEVEMPFFHVAKWREGLMVWAKSYAHREDALRDLGVTEENLERIAP